MNDTRQQVRFRPVIRVFVSSTFSDMKHERNALQEHVFPKLESMCLTNGFQFQAIDLRWGVSTEAGLDHRAMRICFEELRRAQEISPEPNFLILLGDRYGWRPLPEAISHAEFEELATAARTGGEKQTPLPGAHSKTALQVLEDWYRCDKNVVLLDPPETDPDRAPLNYLLQPRTQNLGDGCDYKHRKDDPTRDMQDWLDVQEVLWGLINAAFPAKGRQWFSEMDWPQHVAEVNDRLHPKRAVSQITRFQASATEQEIWYGALSAADAERHVIACFREITNRNDFAAADVKDFFDVVDRKFDTASAKRQSDLKAAVKQRLGANRPLTIPFSKLKREDGKVFVDASEADNKAFCDVVFERFRPIIERQIEEYWDKSEKDSPDRAARELEIEQREYERFARERGGEELFVGRQVELQAILEYVGSESRRPLVIHGASGCGKTALLARASQEVAKTRKRIERFIGVAPRSSDLRSLLSSLCQELRQRNPRADALPTEIMELRDEFSQHLQAVVPKQPLILFLDALDQLTDADNGRLLNWLPPGSLPAHVKLVVSCLSDRGSGDPAGQPYAELKRRQIPAENFVNLDALSEAEARLLLFDRWLPKSGRKVSDDQRARIEQRLASPACRQPIFLKLLFEEVQLWHSYDPAPVPGETVPAILGQLFDRLSLETNHGPLLVHRVLGYLSAARPGLTETEILELLFRDQPDDAGNPGYKAYLDAESARNNHLLPTDPPRIPIAIWSRLYSVLAPYLNERKAEWGTVLTFFHRQLGEWGKRNLNMQWNPHRRIADYLEVLGTANRHTLSEFAYHLRQANDHERLYRVLRKSTLTDCQVAEFADYGKAFEAYRHGLDAFVERNGTETQDDRRLCELALGAGLLSDRAVSSTGVAFQWAREGQMERALKRLSVLAGTDYLKATILLLWIEAERVQTPPLAEQITSGAKTVLEAIEARVPEGVDTTDWKRVIDEKFIVSWGCRVLNPEVVTKLTGKGHEATLILTDVAVQLAQQREGNQALRFIQHLEDSSYQRLSDLDRVLQALLESNCFSNALAITEMLDNEERAIGALREIVESLFKAGSPQAREEIIQQIMHRAGRIQAARHRSKAFTELASAFSESKERSLTTEAACRAFDAAKLIDVAWAQSDACKTLTGIFVANGDYDAAVQASCAIVDPDERLKALTELIKELSQAGKERSALEAIHGACEAAKQTSATWGNTGTLKELIQSCIRHKEFELAHLVAGLVGKSSADCESLVSIAVALLRSGMRFEMEELYVRIFAELQTAGDDRHKCDAYVELAQELFNLNESQGAQEAFQNALNVGEILTWDKIAALSHIGQALALIHGSVNSRLTSTRPVPAERRSLTARILRIFGSFKVVTNRSRTPPTDNRHSGWHSLSVRVLDSLRESRGDSGKTMALVDLGLAFARADEEAKARQALDAALSAAEQQHESRDRAAELSQVGAALLQAGMTKDGDRVFAMAIAVANETTTWTTAGPKRDAAGRASSLAGIGVAFSQAGKAEEARAALTSAEDTARSITYESSRAVTLAAIAGSWAQLGDEARAESLFDDAWLAATSDPDYPLQTAAMIAGTIAEHFPSRGELLSEGLQLVGHEGGEEAPRMLLAKIMTALTQTDVARRVRRARIALDHLDGMRGTSMSYNRNFRSNVIQAFVEEDGANSMSGFLRLFGDQYSGEHKGHGDKLGEHVRAFAESKDFEFAVELAKRMAGFSYLGANIIEETILHLGKEDGSKQDLLDALDVVSSTATKDKPFFLSAIAQALARSGDAEQAFTVLPKIKDERSKADALIGMIRSLAERGGWGEGDKLWHRLLKTAQRLQEDYRLEAFHRIAEALLECGERRRAVTVLELATDAVENAGKAERRSAGFLKTAELYLRLGERERALAASLSARDAAKQISITDYQCAALLKTACALEQLGEAALADAVFRTIPSVLSNPAVEGDGDRTASSVTVMLLEAKQPQVAWEAALHIRGNDSRSLRMSQVARVFLECGDSERAQQVFAETITRSATPASGSADANRLAWAFLNVREYDRALKLAQEIVDQSQRSAVLSKVAQGMVLKNDLDRALGILGSITDQKQKRDAVMALIQALAESGKFDQALALASELEFDYRPAGESLIAQRLAIDGDWDRALEIAKKIDRNFAKTYGDQEKSEALTVVAESLALAALPERAGEVFRWAEDAARSNRGILCRIAAALARCQRSGRALELIDEAIAGTDRDIEAYNRDSWKSSAPQLQKMLRLNDSFKVVAQAMAEESAISNIFRDLTAILKTLVEIPELPGRTGLLKRVLMMSPSFESPAHQSRAVSLVFSLLAESADFPERESLLQESVEAIRKLAPGWRHSALRTVGVALVQQGDAASAYQTLQEAASDAGLIESPTQRLHALLELVEAFGSLGDDEEASHLLLLLSLRAASDVPESRDRSEACLKVAIALAQREQEKEAAQAFAQASENAARVDDENVKLKLQLDVAQAFADLGHREDAVQVFLQAYSTAMQISDPEKRRTALLEVSQSLAPAADLGFTPFFLGRTSLPKRCISDAIQQWREVLLKKSPDPLSTLRESLRLLPFDHALAHHGVCSLQIAHIQSGNWKQHQAIGDLVRSFGSGAEVL